VQGVTVEWKDLRGKVTTFAGDYGYVDIILLCYIIENYTKLVVEMLVEGIEFGRSVECDDCGMATLFN
jgi:hypothetical protein